MSEKPYGEILDEMDHQAKYQSATMEQNAPMKLPNDCGLAEMLEGTRAELRRAIAKIAKLEVEKSELANMVLVYAYRAKHTEGGNQWSAAAQQAQAAAAKVKEDAKIDPADLRKPITI